MPNQPEDQGAAGGRFKGDSLKQGGSEDEEGVAEKAKRKELSDRQALPQQLRRSLGGKRKQDFWDRTPKWRVKEGKCYLERGSGYLHT